MSLIAARYYSDCSIPLLTITWLLCFITFKKLIKVGVSGDTNLSPPPGSSCCVDSLRIRSCRAVLRKVYCTGDRPFLVPFLIAFIIWLVIR